MKVLMVISPNFSTNPFIKTLCQDLQKKDIDTTMGLKEFWKNASDYNIIHFHWPEAIYNWKRHITNKQTQQLEETIIKAKSKGSKIVITCHNLKPHTITNQNVISLYGILYRHADLFLHMGNYSLQLIKNKYPHAEHDILPHHIYNSIYSFQKSKTESRQLLNINKNKCNILCFGEFRNNEERKIILYLKKEFKNQNISFSTPGFYRKRIITKRFWNIPSRLIMTLYYKLLGIKFNNHILNNEQTELYFSASDIVLIQRKNILNSGNLPMAFHAGKVVIGPDTGNVGEILRKLGNPTFNPDKINTTIKAAIQQAINLKDTDLGLKNQKYALDNWSEEIIVNRIIQLYSKILIK